MGQVTGAGGGWRPDIIAGLTASAVVLPKAMAYATVAGLPVSVGLYTAFVPMIVYALLGTSRVLSVSSTSTLAILVATQLGLAVPDGDPTKLLAATATLTILTGLILIVASLLRFGFVANFISLPVLTGFKAGIGIVIVMDQVPKLFGIHLSKEGVLRDLLHLIEQLPEASGPTLIVAAIAMGALLAMEWRRPHSPAPLLVIGGSILASWALGLGIMGVETVGTIPRGLPSLTLPNPELALQMLPGALGIALMSFTETIAVGRAFWHRGDPPVRPGRELLATGASNVAGAFLGSMPAGGGMSQTAVVRSVGGQTRTASLVTAGVAAATMLVLAPLLGLMPLGVLAATVIVYSISLIQPAEFASIRRVRPMEFLWALAAFVGVLAFGTLQGILVAIILSLLGLASQTAVPRVMVLGREKGSDRVLPMVPGRDDLETFEGLLMVRPEGRIFFANAEQIGDRIRRDVHESNPRVVILDCSRVFDIEYSALRMLIDSETKFAEEGATLWLAGLNPGVLESVRKSGLAEMLGSERIFPTAREGLKRYLETRAPEGGETASAHGGGAPSVAS